MVGFEPRDKKQFERLPFTSSIAFFSPPPPPPSPVFHGRIDFFLRADSCNAGTLYARNARAFDALRLQPVLFRWNLFIVFRVFGCALSPELARQPAPASFHFQFSMPVSSPDLIFSVDVCENMNISRFRRFWKLYKFSDSRSSEIPREHSRNRQSKSKISSRDRVSRESRFLAFSTIFKTRECSDDRADGQRYVNARVHKRKISLTALATIAISHD